MEGCLQYIFPIFMLLMKTLMKLCVRKVEDFHMISINYTKMILSLAFLMVKRNLNVFKSQFHMLE